MKLLLLTVMLGLVLAPVLVLEGLTQPVKPGHGMAGRSLGK
jgi:hypothetical protein